MRKAEINVARVKMDTKFIITVDPPRVDGDDLYVKNIKSKRSARFVNTIETVIPFSVTFVEIKQNGKKENSSIITPPSASGYKIEFGMLPKVNCTKSEHFSEIAFGDDRNTHKNNNIRRVNKIRVILGVENSDIFSDYFMLANQTNPDILYLTVLGGKYVKHRIKGSIVDNNPDATIPKHMNENPHYKR